MCGYEEIKGDEMCFMFFANLFKERSCVFFFAPIISEFSGTKDRR